MVDLMADWPVEDWLVDWLSMDVPHTNYLVDRLTEE